MSRLRCSFLLNLTGPDCVLKLESNSIIGQTEAHLLFPVRTIYDFNAGGGETHFNCVLNIWAWFTTADQKISQCIIWDKRFFVGSLTKKKQRLFRNRTVMDGPNSQENKDRCDGCCSAAAAAMTSSRPGGFFFFCDRKKVCQCIKPGIKLEPADLNTSRSGPSECTCTLIKNKNKKISCQLTHFHSLLLWF